MKKSTKLIIAAVGLGGLGYFLYKKGLFGKKVTTEVTKDVKKVEDVVKKIVQPIVEPIGDTIAPRSPILPEPVYTPIWAQTEIYPSDVLYPQEGNLVKKPDNNFYEVDTYDRLPVEDRTVRIDYSSGRYNPEETFEYAEKDLNNVRLNKLLYV